MHQRGVVPQRRSGLAREQRSFAARAARAAGLPGSDLHAGLPAIATHAGVRPVEPPGAFGHNPRSVRLRAPAVPRIQRSAHVPYDCEQMYALVRDVDAYPEFLPWCSGARVLGQGEGWQRARIDMARGPLRHGFTTRNRLEPGRRIRVELEDGPFRRLQGDWRFEPADGGCRVSLDLEFELAGRVFSQVAGPVFNHIASTLVDSFCRRAHALHGDA